MALVPHKIVALNELNEGAKNTIAGAVVSLFDTEGNAVTLFDDESGSNGSTAKQTDEEGAVVVYVTAGEYDEQVNGGIQRRVTVGGRTVVSYANTLSLENSRPTQTWQRAENRERGLAQYELAASGYVAQTGDVVAANGRVWALRVDGDVNVLWLGASGEIDDTEVFQSAVNLAISKNVGVYIPPTDEGFIVKSVDITGLKSLRGDGLSSVVKQRSDISANEHMFYGDSSSDIFIHGLYLDGSAVVSGEEARLIDLRIYSNVTVDNVWFYESSSSSLKVRGSASPNICKNITVTNCRSIRSGRANTANRNGIDFFKCQNVVVTGNTVIGSGFVPNNVGIIFMGCQYVTCSNNILEDNGSEQVQVIGTEFLTELPIDSENRTKYVTISDNIFRHVNGYSNTTNLNLGENANFIKVTGNDFSGALRSEVLITPYTSDIVISNNTMHDGQSGGVTVGDECYGNITISNNIIKDMQGAAGVTVFSDTTETDNVVIEGNTISNLDTDGSSTYVRPFEIRGSNVGDVTIRGNICKGSYTHAVDTTSCVLVGYLFIYDNDFSGYTDTGWRSPKREAYCWNNIEPDSESPVFFRASYSFDIAANDNDTNVWSTSQIEGNLVYRLSFDSDSGPGYATISEGVTGSGDKKIRISEVSGLGGVKGTLYSFAKP